MYYMDVEYDVNEIVNELKRKYKIITFKGKSRHVRRLIRRACLLRLKVKE